MAENEGEDSVMRYADATGLEELHAERQREFAAHQAHDTGGVEHRSDEDAEFQTMEGARERSDTLTASMSAVLDAKLEREQSVEQAPAKGAKRSKRSSERSPISLGALKDNILFVAKDRFLLGIVGAATLGYFATKVLRKVR
jgi:hypothetical protein